MLGGLDARTYSHANFYGLGSFPSETMLCVCVSARPTQVVDGRQS